MIYVLTFNQLCFVSAGVPAHADWVFHLRWTEGTEGQGHSAAQGKSGGGGCRWEVHAGVWLWVDIVGHHPARRPASLGLPLLTTRLCLVFNRCMKGREAGVGCPVTNPSWDARGGRPAVAAVWRVVSSACLPSEAFVIRVVVSLVMLQTGCIVKPLWGCFSHWRWRCGNYISVDYCYHRVCVLLFLCWHVWLSLADGSVCLTGLLIIIVIIIIITIVTVVIVIKISKQDYLSLKSSASDTFLEAEGKPPPQEATNSSQRMARSRTYTNAAHLIR